MPPPESGSGRTKRGRLQRADARRFPILSSTRSQDGWSFEIEVPADSPYFEGHFEDAPVLPGVAQLALLVQLYERARGTLLELREVTAMRFRDPILPGDVLQATISPMDSDGRSRFALHRHGTIVSHGTVSWFEEIR